MFANDIPVPDQPAPIRQPRRRRGTRRYVPYRIPEEQDEFLADEPQHIGTYLDLPDTLIDKLLKKYSYLNTVKYYRRHRDSSTTARSC